MNYKRVSEGMFSEEIDAAIKRYKPIEDRMRSHPEIKINEASSKDQHKKIVERDTLLQIISIIDEGISIVSATESPDFELLYNNVRIGAELVSIVEVDENIAKIDKLTRVVETMLARMFPNHKYLIRYTLYRDITSENISKDALFEILSTAIRSTQFENYGKIDVPKNDHIKHIYYMRSSTLSLHRNEGAVILSDVTSEQINKEVDKKNKKLKDYNSSLDEQWLFMTIPTRGMFGNLDLPDDLSDIINNLVDNRFDRIYLSCITRIRRIK